jgi:hypothetical protein
VQETINKVRIVSGRSVFFSMNFILKNEWTRYIIFVWNLLL